MAHEQAIADAIVTHLQTQFANEDKTQVYAFTRFYKDDVLHEAERLQKLVLVTYMGSHPNEGTVKRPLGLQKDYVISIFYKGGKEFDGLYDLIDQVQEAMNSFEYMQHKANYVKDEALPMPVQNGIFVAEILYWIPTLNFP